MSAYGARQILRSRAIEATNNIPLIVGCSIAGILNVVCVKLRVVSLSGKDALRVFANRDTGRWRIYMGTFRVAVSIGLFENFHLGNNFQAMQARHAPRSIDAGAPSLTETSAGLLVESEEGTADSGHVREWQLFGEALACTCAV